MAKRDTIPNDWKSPNDLTQEKTLAALGVERTRPEGNGKTRPRKNTLKVG
jgi:hypothetical protein